MFGNISLNFDDRCLDPRELFFGQIQFRLVLENNVRRKKVCP